MSSYNKTPGFPVSGELFSGWDSIRKKLKREITISGRKKYIIVVECYQGVNHEELIPEFMKLSPRAIIHSKDAFYEENVILELTYPDVTDDAIFGYMTRLSYNEFLNPLKVDKLQNLINISDGLVIVYGHAAAIIAKEHDCLIYADMTRWEIQLRQRNHEVHNLGLKNSSEAPAAQYKRGYFVDWRVCDKLKQRLFSKADFWLDTNRKNYPQMIPAQHLLDGLSAISHSPFRLVPYFDPGPWGGQWMKEICDLDKFRPNYAWSFDGVPEENSLLFCVGDEVFEQPAINLVFYKSKELLGEPVESRFGKEFPIRFDFLDTMDGGNLSLQVHPTVQYIRDTFGMTYTQDESYYLLDVKPGAKVFLGVKTGIQPGKMIAALQDAKKTGGAFKAEEYINQFPAKRHDHFLIPNGTVHCSGADCMVLEISSTPYIFTFKLYDWGRPGLDGEPRTINIEHGLEVIQWERNTEYCRDNLINNIEQIAAGDGWREERTGLHKNEFIETRRHWFTQTVTHHTCDSVNVLNLVQGEEVIVESPSNDFSPLIVHYAKTFIVPASAGVYTIRPFGESIGKECATIKAYIRF